LFGRLQVIGTLYRLEDVRTAITLTVIALAYALAGFGLYRGRVVTADGILDSDILVFLAPALFALAANTLCLWRSLRSSMRLWTRLGVAIAGGITATVIAAAGYMFVAFNAYGT
jgi:hypothetical protein